MKAFSISRSSQLALLVAMACSPTVWAAEGGDAPAQAAPAQAAPAPTETVSPSGEAAATMGGQWFDTSISAGQQAFTPNYEQNARGIFATDKTALTRGTPIRTSSGAFFYPSVDVGFGHNDNILGTPADLLSSSLMTIQPGIVGEMKNRGDRYTASYVGNYTRYFSSSADDFNHHNLTLAGDNIFTSRARLSWAAGYIASSDPRGATDRAVSPEVDRWHSPLASALFTYGAASATGRVELEASIQDKRYTNNREYTEAADVNLSNLAGRFFYRVAPKTSVLFELRNTMSNYQSPISVQDSTENRYYVGATWDATAATTGIIKLGQLRKSFDNNPGIEDFSGFSWEGLILWKPLTYSTVNLVTSKSTSDSTGYGAYVLNENLNVVWNHNWTSYLATHVAAGALKSDYIYTDRNDSTNNFGLGVTYDLRRWLRAGAEWMGTRRDSSLPEYDFDRNVFMLTLEGTL